MDYKIVLGITATVLAFFSYIPYFRDIWQGKTKPHAFSWLVWGTLTAIAFAGQVADKGGAGAWVTGFTAVVCLLIFAAAVWRGEKRITTSDWLSLLGAAVALGLWGLTKSPLLSVILITLIDAFGFFPTFRKSYFKPHSETLITYVISSFKFVLALIALDNFTVVTSLYPISLVLMNGAFAVMLVIRRQHVKA